jgi:elongation factor Ts
MEISAKLVKELRDQTALPMMQCKHALEETGGDMEKAVDLLRKQGAKTAEKRAHRSTGNGGIGTYIHHDGKLGVMVEVDCETDFAAKSDHFQQFLKDLSLHVAFHNPLAVAREQVPAEIVSKEREIILGQIEQDEKIRAKPDAVKQKVADGRIDKFFAERVLLEQPFVRDDKLTVKDVLRQLIQKTGENVAIRRFARFKVGE